MSNESDRLSVYAVMALSVDRCDRHRPLSIEIYANDRCEKSRIQRRTFRRERGTSASDDRVRKAKLAIDVYQWRQNSWRKQYNAMVAPSGDAVTRRSTEIYRLDGKEESRVAPKGWYFKRAVMPTTILCHSVNSIFAGISAFRISCVKDFAFLCAMH